MDILNSTKKDSGVSPVVAVVSMIAVIVVCFSIIAVGMIAYTEGAAQGVPNVQFQKGADKLHLYLVAGDIIHFEDLKFYDETGEVIFVNNIGIWSPNVPLVTDKEVKIIVGKNRQGNDVIIYRDSGAPVLPTGDMVPDTFPTPNINVPSGPPYNFNNLYTWQELIDAAKNSPDQSGISSSYDPNGYITTAGRVFVDDNETYWVWQRANGHVSYQNGVDNVSVEEYLADLYMNIYSETSDDLDVDDIVANPYNYYDYFESINPNYNLRILQVNLSNKIYKPEEYDGDKWTSTTYPVVGSLYDDGTSLYIFTNMGDSTSQYAVKPPNVNPSGWLLIGTVKS